MPKIHRLDVSWSTSRGRDTYGYNICRLDDSETGQRFRTCGGGYDMIGTVFAQWLESAFPEKLAALKDGATLEDCGYAVPGYKKRADLYGLTFRPDGSASLDGACGISSMIRVAEAIGLECQWSGNRKGHTVAYYVFPKE